MATHYVAGPDPLIADLLAALGFDGHSVKRLVLEIDQDSVVTAYVQEYVDGRGLPAFTAKIRELREKGGVRMVPVNSVDVTPDGEVRPDVIR